MRKQRNSGFELLRIVAMVLIVAHHLALHGTGVPKERPFLQDIPMLNNILNNLYLQGGKLGCSIFIALTGYFGIEKENDWKHLIPIEIAAITYCVGVFAFNWIMGFSAFSLRALVKCLFPITFVQYWFLTTYFVVYLLSPFMNQGLSQLTQEQYKRFLEIVVMLFFLVPLINKLAIGEYYDLYRGYTWNSMIWLSIYYCVGGYLRKFGIPNKKYIAYSGLLYGAILLVRCLLWRLFPENQMAQMLSMYVFWDDSLLILLCTYWLILGFGALKLQCGWINTAASACLGVYLIHDNENIRYLLWQAVLKTRERFQSSAFWLWSLAAIVGIYIGCTCVELLRKCVEQWLEKNLKRIKSRT